MRSYLFIIVLAVIVLCPILAVAADSQEKPAWQAKLEGPRIVYGGDVPQVTLIIEGSPQKRVIDYRCKVVNYYGQPVGEPLTGQVKLKGNEASRQSLTLPKVKNVHQYRITVELNDRSSNQHTQIIRLY